MKANTPLPTNSINWAGYIVASNATTPQNGTVTSVNGTWIVQRVITVFPTGIFNYGFSSQWIGIDGAINGNLIQTGTESDSSNVIFNSTYYAWWEVLPAPETLIPNFTVKYGDVMYASINKISQNKWSIELKDITRNETFNNIVNYTAPESSAEWIDERTYVGYFPPLAVFNISYYGSNYTNIPNTNFATVNGVVKNIKNLPHVAINMSNLYGTGNQAVPYNLSNNGSFKVKYFANIFRFYISEYGNNTGYAGYLAASNKSWIHNGAVTMINGSWIVQKSVVSDKKQLYSSQFIDLGLQYLLELGTISNNYNETYNNKTYNTSYAYFKSTYDHNIIHPIPNFSIKAGDKIYAKIKLINFYNQTWNLYLKDYTRNETYNSSLNNYSDAEVAEWGDGGRYGSGSYQLLNFNTAYYGSNFTYINNTNFATIDGITGDINKLENAQAKLKNYNNTFIEAFPSNLTKNGSFEIFSVLNITTTTANQASSVDLNKSITITSTPWGGVVPYTYQWYEKSPTSNTFNEIIGANQINYTFLTTKNTTLGKWYFYVTLKDESNVTAFSTPLQIIVNNVPTLKSNVSISKNAIDIGQNFSIMSNTLSINGTGPYKYSWYVKSPVSEFFKSIPNSGPLNFMNTTPILTKINGQTCTAKNNSIYCVSGLGKIEYCSTILINTCYNTTQPNTEQSSNVYNGTIYGRVVNNKINWSYTTPYPKATYGNDCIIMNKNIYCIGGGQSNVFPQLPSNITQYAQLTSNGIEVWYNTSVYPFETFGIDISCNGYNNTIYCVDGNVDGIYSNSVYYAGITSNGINGWQSTTPYPTNSYEISCFTYTEYLYCIGGYPSNSIFNSYYTKMTANGIGVWSPTTNYPLGNFSLPICNSLNNYVYCSSGTNNFNNTYYAELSANGIGTWIQSSPYPVHINEDSCVITEDKRYCIGGNLNPGVPSNITNRTYFEILIPANYTVYTNSSYTPGLYKFKFYGTDIYNNSVNSTNVSVMINPTPAISAPFPINPVVDNGHPVSYKATLTGGTGPFTVNLIENGAVVNTLTNQNDGTISFGNYTPALGIDTFNVIAVDDGTSPQYVFNSTYNSIRVTTKPILKLLPTNAIIEVNQRLIFNDSVINGSKPYVFTYLANNAVVKQNSKEFVFSYPGNYIVNSTVTDYYNESSTYNSPIEVINQTGTQLNESVVIPQNGLFDIGFENANVVLGVSSNTEIVANVMIRNLSKYYNTQPSRTLTSFTKIDITGVNESFSSNGQVSSAITEWYTCGYQISPYQLINGTWNELNITYTNATYCAVSFDIPSNGIFGLFRYQTIQPQNNNEGGGGGGGGAGGGLPHPNLTKTSYGYLVSRFGVPASFQFNICNKNVSAILNFINPNGAGISLNDVAYTLTLGNNPTNITGLEGCSMQLYNVSYIPLQQTVQIKFFEPQSSLISNNTALNKTSNYTYISNIEAKINVQKDKSISIKSYDNQILVRLVPKVNQSLMLKLNRLNISKLNNTPNGYKVLELYNLSITPQIGNVTLGLKYNCSINSNKITPFYLNGSKWEIIDNYTENIGSCSINFTVASDPIFGLFEVNNQNQTQKNKTISSNTTINSNGANSSKTTIANSNNSNKTRTNTTTSNNLQTTDKYYYVTIIVIGVAILIIIWSIILKKKNNKTQKKKRTKS